MAIAQIDYSPDPPLGPLGRLGRRLPELHIEGRPERHIAARSRVVPEALPT